MRWWISSCEHVQLSLRDAEFGSGDRIAGLAGAQQAKREAAALIRAAGLTLDAVVHRQNLERSKGLLSLLSNGTQSGPRIGMQKGPPDGIGTGLSR
jgi:hypothetical protein